MSQGKVLNICIPLAGNKTQHYSDADVRANAQAEWSDTPTGCDDPPRDFAPPMPKYTIIK